MNKIFSFISQNIFTITIFFFNIVRFILSEIIIFKKKERISDISLKEVGEEIKKKSFSNAWDRSQYINKKNEEIQKKVDSIIERSRFTFYLWSFFCFFDKEIAIKVIFCFLFYLVIVFILFKFIIKNKKISLLNILLYFFFPIAPICSLLFLIFHENSDNIVDNIIK